MPARTPTRTTCRPGKELVSPAAFVGVFAGDWDDAFNACRWYVDDEIIPQIEKPWPTTLHVYVFHNQPEKRNDAYLRARDRRRPPRPGSRPPMWRRSGGRRAAMSGDFSTGLGDFSDSRVKFPMGLRAMSDHVHSQGHELWPVVRDRAGGHPHGQPPAQPLEARVAGPAKGPSLPLLVPARLSCSAWGSRPHKSGRWRTCSGPSRIRHLTISCSTATSGPCATTRPTTTARATASGRRSRATIGSWRAAQGRYPNLMILNSSGGSQRGDFGIARYSNCIHPHDHARPAPSSAASCTARAACTPPAIRPTL